MHPARDNQYLTLEGEQALASMIEEHWREHGHRNVKCRVEQQLTHREPIFVVRSNLVRGLPPSAFALSKGART
jgi:hypothetical protein